MQKLGKKSLKIRIRDLNEYEKIDKMLHQQRLLFVPKIIWIKLISWDHNNSLVDYFLLNKIRELIGLKYYWPSLRKNIEAYFKSCNLCFGLKFVTYKLYGDFQLWLMVIYQWKDFLMYFLTSLPVWIDWKGENYDSILVIID